MAPQSETEFTLRPIVILNWVFLSLMIAGGWLCFDGHVAAGVLAGGLLANISFSFLKNDLLTVLSGPAKIAKVRFFIKYYLRLTLLALILFLLVKSRAVHIFGLLAGLSTVALSITATVAGPVKKIYLTAKEAS